MTKALFAFTLAVVSAGSGIAQDAPPKGGHGRGLLRADTNGDGVVTKAEFDADNAKRFARLDANHDGRIDATEMARVRDRVRGMRQGGQPPMGETPPVTGED